MMIDNEDYSEIRSKTSQLGSKLVPHPSLRMHFPYRSWRLYSAVR